MGRDCVVVVGTHRSGTSAMARSISLLGLELPTHMIPADPGNLAGHWEPEPLVRLHDRLLIRAGSRWDDWRALRLDASLLASYRAEATAVLDEEFPGTGPVVVKDPRISRFTEEFGDVLDFAGYTSRWIVMVRHPLEVAASLADRNDVAIGAAQLIWLRHQLDAERGTRERQRCVVSYDSLLRDWQPVVAATTNRLGLSPPRSLEDAAHEIDSFLSSELRHHRESDTDLAADDRLNEWVKAAYKGLIALTEDPFDSAAVEQLDAVRRELDSVPAAFNDAAASIQAHASALARRSRKREQEVEQAAATHREQLARLASDHQRERDQLAQAHRRELNKVKTRLKQTGARLDSVLNSRWWRATHPARRITGWFGRLRKAVR